MNRPSQHKRKIAAFFLTLIITNLFLPQIGYALTSGPSQPETKAFQPANVSDMVDLFTGDLKYNIPLMDVDGYPINLNYQQGSGMDDEASWTGLGWNVNIGSVNRQLRGVPDDLLGDELITTHTAKPKVTVGGKVSIKTEIGGGFKGSGSLSVGVFNDNYTGMGAEFGVNAGMSFGFTNNGPLTAGLGVGVLSSTSDGVSVSPYANLSIRQDVDSKVSTSQSVGASLGYNSRAGMKNLSLNASFGVSPNPASNDKNKEKGSGGSYGLGGMNFSYNTEPVNPKVTIPYVSTYNSFSFDIGGVAGIFFTGGGGSGYKSVRKVKEGPFSNPQYGFLYAERGKNEPNAIMDFVREKDNPVVPDLPNLALPVATPDIFSYTSQAGSGQFRLHRNGSGVFFDNQVKEESTAGSLGFDVGVGYLVHGGVTLFDQTTKNTTTKWKENNDYLKYGDFMDATGDSSPGTENVYFKQIGEKGTEDADAVAKFKTDQAVAVQVSGKNASANLSGLQINPDSALRRTARDKRTTSITYLTAEEAQKYGLDKKIKKYPIYDISSTFVPADSNGPFVAEEVRETAIRRKHHISQITVTDGSGIRNVYGLPVYNTKQEEYTFAVGRNNVGSQSNKIPIQAADITNNQKGIDNYSHKESRPAYATSFLLTGILSPDYVDVDDNGISDQDQGTAIKFNYAKAGSSFKWRTPYGLNKATLNRAQPADMDDDKGSIVYGEKELWYPSSIESKTQVAYFITEDRLDGLGADYLGNIDIGTRQKRLREIRLYSKSDRTKPIKVVKFEYDYSLCPTTPNHLSTSNDPNKGKLTLTKVWFEYGKSTKGANHKYKFYYNQQVAGQVVQYGDMMTDRWGTYKPANADPQISNEEFPYTQQDKTKQDQYAGLWNLSRIELPTGGIIRVGYESDDYAYVQNKRAMTMEHFTTLIRNDAGDATNSLADAVGFKMNIIDHPNFTDELTARKWFKRTYLNNDDYIYTRFNVKVATGNSYTDSNHENDFIPVYAGIKKVIVTGNIANVYFQERNGENPIRYAAWQRIKEEYPRYAYRGFDERQGDDTGGSAAGAVRSIISAVSNLSELNQNFYERAKSKGYASEWNSAKSFVRLVKTNGFKLGGGARVKYVQILDDWKNETASNAVAGAYGQAYKYTTKDQDGEMSSGVAAYEPTLGGEENPLHQPVGYSQRIKGALTNYYDLEAPFGESFFPGPSVGYSTVTVTDLKNDAETTANVPDPVEDPNHQTGYVVNEFYTARDFPVRTTVLPIMSNSAESSGEYSMLSNNVKRQAIYSQGYSIDLNDMNGKTKANRVYNKARAEISSTVYYYNATNTGAGGQQLKNIVRVVNPVTGQVTSKTMGRDIDFFTDFREQESINTGNTFTGGFDGFVVFAVPIYIPHIPIFNNTETKLFRSACAVKVNHYFGLVDSVVRNVNGSHITTENYAFDGLTGEPLVTRTQNEFNKDIFSVNIPAYWAYKGMGPAATTEGMIVQKLQTATVGSLKGVITNSTISGALMAGDELIGISNSGRYWIIDAPTGTGKILIDEDGNPVNNFNSGNNKNKLKLVRSGYRNLLGAGVSSVTCLNNPIQQVNSVDKFLLANNNTGINLNSLKVLNASASTFDEKWAVRSECIGFKEQSTETAKYYLKGGATSGSYGDAGAKIRTPSGSQPYVFINNGLWSSRLNYCGIWVNQGLEETLEQYLGFETCLRFQEGKVYWFGYAGDNSIVVTVDGVEKVRTDFTDGDLAYRYWRIDPVFIPEGKHNIKVSFANRGPASQSGNSNLAAAGFEIYNNTYQEILNVTSEPNLGLLFSTFDIKNSHTAQTFRWQNGVGPVYHYTLNDAPVDACMLNMAVNPYVTGYLGNWRPYQTMVLQKARQYNDVFSTGKKGIDIKNAGALESFTPYWQNANSATVWAALDSSAAATIKWVMANKVTQYDKYGQQLENKDALQRYSAASFDFNGQLPAAVASNAMKREIWASSFEDVALATIPQLENCVNPGWTFGLTGSMTDTSKYDKLNSHTGKRSLILPSNDVVKMSFDLHTNEQKTNNYLERSVIGAYAYRNLSGLYPNGFAPIPTKKYIFNAWIYGGTSATDVPFSVNLKNSYGLQIATPALVRKATVEGWKLIECVLDMNQMIGDRGVLILSRTGSSAKVLIDDIRIHPYDSHMKTYAYDDSNLRLMAELDENAFATFYEYDDEGILVRVKKETEGGIMTLKETRSSYIKKP